MSNENESSMLKNFEILKDVKLKVSVEFGSTQRTLEELANLSIDSQITLDQLAGESLKLYINDKCVGTCEPIIINEKFGIKILNLVE